MDIRFSRNVLRDLEAEVERQPDLSTERGDLFLAQGRAVIKLKVGFEEYFEFLNCQPKHEKPRANELFPIQNGKFDMVLNFPASVRDGEVFDLDGKKVTVI